MPQPLSPDILIIADDTHDWCKNIRAWLPPALSCVTTRVIDKVDLRRVSILLGAPPDLAAVIPRCPRLAWVQSTWAGIEAISHFAGDSLRVTALKGVFGQSMSEYVFGWLLALERNILGHADARTWHPSAGNSTFGKTLGIMGTGSIGSALTPIARQLGMTCRGLNTDGHHVDGFDQIFASNERLSFSKGLDYLVNVLPQTSATDSIINRDLLMRLNDGAIMINAGRANAVDNAALLAALSNGQLRYAVLDVFAEEPLPPEHIFWRQDNLFITSHTAAVTGGNAIVEVFKENFTRYISGKALLYSVSAKHGY